MQIARFHTGGFVLHKITFAGYSGKFSAWYEPTGELSDCEQYTQRGQTRPVKRGANLWEMIRATGQRFVDAMATPHATREI